MTDDHGDQNAFLQDPKDEENPMTKIQEDEALNQDYDTPFNEDEGEGDADDEEEEVKALKEHPQTDTNQDPQQQYNEALADALEIRPTMTNV